MSLFLDHLKTQTVHTQVCHWLALRRAQVACLLNVGDFIVQTFELPLFDGDFIDVLAKDKVIPVGGRVDKSDRITCFVVEVKSDKGDHGLLGQIKKSVNVMEKVGVATGLFDEVRGVAVADEYTISGFKLLKDEGYDVLYWCWDGDTVSFSKRRVF